MKSSSSKSNPQDLSENYSYEYSPTSVGLSEENTILKACVAQLQEELGKLKKSPLIACTVKTIINDRVLVKLPNGNHFLVHKLSGCPQLFPGDTVLADQKNLTILEKIPTLTEHDIEQFLLSEKPSLDNARIGGLSVQQRLLHEVVTLPLLKPQQFSALGITPPKGVLLHGPPGTGKTLLARAIAAETKATFFHVVSSELVQKFIGEGAHLVKDLFRRAQEHAPSIIFLDEIDAIASTRLELGTGGEREVQRTFLQLLAELDGFAALDKVKIIACTNRKDILDPALLRPGRIDRIIEVPLPEHNDRKEILSLYARTMATTPLEYDHLATITNGFTGADLKAACTEAGYFALREGKNRITGEHFTTAIQDIKRSKEEETTPTGMFG